MNRSWRMKKTVLTTGILLAMVTSAPAAAGDAVQLFRQLPAPPASLAAAVAKVSVESSPRAMLRAPANDAISKTLETRIKAGGTAAAQQQVDQMGLGIDMQRMQSDPAYAEQMRQKMSAMSPAEAMALSQRWMNAQKTAAMKPAHPQVQSYLGENLPKDEKVRAEIRRIMERALNDANTRQEAVDAEINSAFVKCPADATGGPELACAGPLAPKALHEHRAVVTRALAQENAAYRKAWALGKARVDAAAPMLAVARRGGDASDLNELSGDIDQFTGMLNNYGRAIVLRAAFWAKAQCRADPVAVNCFVKTATNEEIRPSLQDAGEYQP